MRFFIVLLFFAHPALACESLKGQLNPKLKKKLDAYEKFIVSLQSEARPLPKINQRIKREGILLDAYIGDKFVKSYPSSFVLDMVSEARTLFLRNLKLPPGLTNDIVYEVADAKSEKIVRTWQLPANGSFQGIRGNEIIFRSDLGTPCMNFKRDVTLAASPNGKFRAVEDVKFPAADWGQACPAARKIFSGSDYGACVYLIDLKTKKKRVLVYQTPMT